VLPPSRLQPQLPGADQWLAASLPQVFEAVQPDFSTDEQRRACYKGVPWSTSAGPCTVPSAIGATIK
jgi:hypothetical protein